MRNKGLKRDLNKVLNSIKIPHECYNQQRSPGGEKVNQLDLEHQNAKQEYFNLRYVVNPHRYSINVSQQQSNMFKKERSLELRRTKEKRQETGKRSMDRSPYLKKMRVTSTYKDGHLKQYILNRQLKRTIPYRRYTQNATTLTTSDKWDITAKSEKSQQNINLCEQAKQLFSKGYFKESLKITTQIIQANPHNEQAYYLSGLNLINMAEHRKALKYLNKLIESNEQYNKMMYVLGAMCESKLNLLNGGQSKLLKCIKLFPDCYEAYMSLGRLQYSSNNAYEAIKHFLKANQLKKDKIEPMLGLSQCYHSIKHYQEAIQYLQRAICLEVNNKNEKKCTEYLLKIYNIMKEIGNYKQCEQIFNKYGAWLNNSDLVYKLAICQFKNSKMVESMMNLEEVLKSDNSNIITQAFRLMIVIKIIERDFYEACHLVERAKNYDIKQQQLETYKKFSEGVVCLMKRKHQEGIQHLQYIRSKINIEKVDQFIHEIKKIYYMYLAYGYFCEGNFKQANNYLNKQLKTYDDPKYHKGIEYNQLICLGVIDYKLNKYQDAIDKFTKAELIYPTKPQIHLYKIIVLSKIFLENLMDSVLVEIGFILNRCCELVKDMSNNCAASVFYHRAVYHGYIKQWSQALQDIDEAIERSQQNYAQYFYVRGLILACCQSFKQAIHEMSVAISLNDKWGELYLLRSKCLQIEGNGNEAFIDLQSYIALKPQDTQIHKYAGHLLFENGAFEDAILAYGHGSIEQNTHNFDVFLTRSKTYFLLGFFDKAAADMLVASKLKPQLPELYFDYQIIQLLEEIKSLKNKQYSIKQWSIISNKAHLIYEDKKGIKFGRIFKLIQFWLLKAICSFYEEKYLDSIQSFNRCIEFKQESFKKLVNTDDTSEYEEEQNQKRIYINQMYYNISICYLKLKDYQQAITSLKNCQISPQSKIYNAFMEYMLLVQGNQIIQPQAVQVFSLSNKLSNHLQQCQVPLKNQKKLSIKLCIPYPKVQPPQIFPVFDNNLFANFTIDEVERKPEAPWIQREENSIKFTDKIQIYSRLQMNQSQISQKHKRRDLLLEQGVSDGQSSICIKDRLKLDSNIEEKLQKLINKSHL